VSKDISKILEGWEYDSDQTSVRIVKGDDGRDKIQLRIDLGLLQMEFDGRPDGQRPQGAASLFDWYRQKQQRYDEANPDSTPFRLERDDCARLLREGIQYYHRYLSFWKLGRYELCARDTSRNLKLFAFVREYARHDEDRLQFDQWRPYVIMMHTRAVATPLIELGDEVAALGAIEAGIRAIRQFLEEYGQTDRAEHCLELGQLERWRDEISSHKPRRLGYEPSDWLKNLKLELERAILEERFEDAAQLRDQLRQMDNTPQPPGMEAQ